MGAMLAIRLVMLHPERVRRAVVAGLGANYFREHQQWRDRIAEAMLAEDSTQVEDGTARKFRLFAGQKGKDRLALAACMRASRHMYRPAELKQSKRPVLVVAGEKDAIAGSPFPLAEAFADGRAVVVPDRDHMTAVGDPGYKRAVLAFLSE